MTDREQIIREMDSAREKYHTMKQPTLKWKLFRKCNLKCSYCTVWHGSSGDPSPGIIKKGIDEMSKVVPRSWRIYLTGGEPTANLSLTKTALRKLAGYGYELRTITNLSSSIRIYSMLFRSACGYLRSVFVTRHREAMPINRFVQKIIELKNIAGSQCEIVVRQVVEKSRAGIDDFLITRDRLKYHAIELRPIRLIETVGTQKQFADYRMTASGDEISNIFPGSVNFHNRRGTYCPAGYEYVYVSPNLDAYRCIPYIKSEEGYLGNFLKGNVTLQTLPTLCALEICHCVPGR